MIGALCLLGGCGLKARLPEHPIVYEQGINEEEGYAYLFYGDKVFVPYCAYESEDAGSCIGYCDIPADAYSDGARVYIFELKGYSSEEWIIESLEQNNCNEGMILREVNVTEAPDGLVSDYGWNRF